MTRHRVVVTGIGLVSSLGNDPATVADSLCRGLSGVVDMPDWRELGLVSTIAGDLRVDERRSRSAVPRRRLETLGPVAAHCVLAAEDAIADASLQPAELSPDDCGCIIGCGVGSMPAIYQGGVELYAGRPRRVRPYSVLQSMASAPSAAVAQTFGVGGRSYSLSSACATSAHAIGHGAELVRTGALRRVLVGGGEEISSLLGAAFGALRAALSQRNDRPQQASRPFDRDRDGFVLSGGAGVLVLESLVSAVERGAPIRGEVLGFGANTDGHDPIQPAPDGDAAARCMRAALADAEIAPADVDLVNAHATSTIAGDLAEARALARVFDASPPPVTATKSLGGHSLGAAGALEAIHSLLMMEGGFVAGTANLEHADPELASLQIVTETSPSDTHVHLSNSFGFGGANATLILGRGPTG